MCDHSKFSIAMENQCTPRIPNGIIFTEVFRREGTVSVSFCQSDPLARLTHN